MRQKLVTSHDTLMERNEAPIVTVFNKADKLNEPELERRKRALSALAPNPIVVSGLTGENVDELRARVERELPDWERERLMLPVNDEAMSLVSWVHDNGHVREEEYGDEQVLLEFEAPPVVVSKARARAAEAEPAGAGREEAR
jgi:GTP-binding protein HflX